MRWSAILKGVNNLYYAFCFLDQQSNIYMSIAQARNFKSYTAISYTIIVILLFQLSTLLKFRQTILNDIYIYIYIYTYI